MPKHKKKTHKLVVPIQWLPATQRLIMRTVASLISSQFFWDAHDKIEAKLSNQNTVMNVS